MANFPDNVVVCDIKEIINKKTDKPIHSVKNEVTNNDNIPQRVRKFKKAQKKNS